MKKIWLMGGFGNVLFQILAFRVILKSNSNTKYVKKLTEKNFITNILGWKIHQKLYHELIDENQFCEVNDLKACLLVLISQVSKLSNFKIKIATFYSSKLQLEKDVSTNVFGYFQDNSFLKSNQSELAVFGELLNKKYSFKDRIPVVVHYRRGDSNLALKLSSYYEKVKQMLTNEDSNILIVTDSINDAKMFFKGIKNTKIISSKDALEDFKFLVSAEKLYCAPSTFSWWASIALPDNSEVIIPKYFRDNLGVFIKSKKIKII